MKAVLGDNGTLEKISVTLKETGELESNFPSSYNDHIFLTARES